MSIVLQSEQREQAGSDSYNRFEYQSYCIVLHILQQFKENVDCIIFCEYHDDMAHLSDQKSMQFEFYQIKTKDSCEDWTVAELSKREKDRKGYNKKSFLGFMFYNFYHYGNECSHCHFVTNCSFDMEVRTWQAVVDDGKNLKVVNPELYEKLRKRIKVEYEPEVPKDFDDIFHRFVQNTTIRKSDLGLNTYMTQVGGIFLEMLSTMKITSDVANTVLKQIINDVRQKSIKKIEAPISLKQLIKLKGIPVWEVKQMLENNIADARKTKPFKTFLVQQGLEISYIDALIASMNEHDTRWLDVEDIKYQEMVLLIRKTINELLNSQDTNLDLPQIRESCYKALNDNDLSSLIIDKNLIEVLLYEQLLRCQDNPILQNVTSSIKKSEGAK